MAFVTVGNLLAGATTVFNNVVGHTVYPCIFDQVRHYAARIGTRQKKLKLAKQAKLLKARKLLKLAEQKKQRKMKKYQPLEKIVEDDVLRGPPIDDVWTWKFFQWPVFTMDEVVQAFSEAYHPTIANITNPNIVAFIELDLTADKKGKFVGAFSRMRLLPHVIPPKVERKIIAFTNNSTQFKEALELGADVVGGKDLIKQIQAGQVDVRGFDYHVTDTNTLPDVMLIKGILKERVPSFKLETLSGSVLPLIAKFKNGLQYSVKPHEIYPQYGTCSAMIGTLDMGADKLSHNLSALVQDIYVKKPKFRETFVTRIQIQSGQSREKFKVDLNKYIPAITTKNEKTNETEAIDEDDERDTASVVIASD